MKPALIRSLSLLSFLFLISTFLLYRVGKFDKYLPGSQTDLQSSHNGGTINATKKDSVILKLDSAQIQMLSSSKSIVIPDKKYVFFDTGKNKIRRKSAPANPPIMMSSSKSGHIFPPPAVYFNLDSIKYDIKKLKKKKN